VRAPATPEIVIVNLREAGRVGFGGDRVDGFDVVRRATGQTRRRKKRRSQKYWSEAADSWRALLSTALSCEDWRTF